MIAREQFRAYNEAVARLSDGAADAIESGIWAWLQTDEGGAATVAECREYAKYIMSGVIQRYDEAAATLAAKWYDKQAHESHAKLPSAVTATVYDPKRVDETARYQAGKLVKGDLRGFARYCGELGRNDVLRSLNETVLQNAARDGKRGVRFARVPTGAETCPFCLMLAGRGAVYHTRKTAGEFRHFHRRCDCKVVPGFEDDPDAEIVKGFSPAGLRDRIGRIEQATGMSFSDSGDSSELGKYIRLLDEDWLYGGVPPDVDYSANPLENYGNPKLRRCYEFDNFEDHDGEWRDVFAHDALASAGIKVKPLPATAPDGFSNIDLSLNGELWEVKSPYDERGKSRAEMRFVEKNLRRAKKQFANQWDERTGGRLDYDGPTRIVFNSFYVNVDDGAIEAELARQMRAHHVDEVIFVKKNGEVRFMTQ